MPLVFGIISKNNQYDAERKITSYTFQKDLLIFYRIPLLTSDVVWATIFRDENHQAPSSSLQVSAIKTSPRMKRFGHHHHAPRDARKEASFLSFFSFLDPATKAISTMRRFRPHKGEERKERAGHTQGEKRGKIEQSRSP